MAYEPITDKFVQSQEAVWRRFVRQSIRNAPLTRAERDVLMALANFWFNHKGRGNALIYPGREKIARRAKVTTKTVSRALKLFRDRGALTLVSHARGGWGKSTRYEMNFVPLMALCGHKLPIQIVGELAYRDSENVPHLPSEMSHTFGDAMSHEYNNVRSHVFPGQELSVARQWSALKLIAGGKR